MNALYLVIQLFELKLKKNINFNIVSIAFATGTWAAETSATYDDDSELLVKY